MRYKITNSIKDKSRLTKDEWREYTKTVWHIANTTDPSHPAVFPIEIPSRLIKLFSFYGETVLDPFAGVGNTAEAALSLGRISICIDQNPRYIRIIRNRYKKIRDISRDNKELRALTGDCRDMKIIADESIHLIVTSPPYWNKIDYGPKKENLGNENVYVKFLENIRPAFGECFRVLMPGRKICIVIANVNQHTNHGLLTFPLASDFCQLLRDIGFVMINEIIWSKDGTGGKWGSAKGQRPIFGSYPYPPNFLFKNVHEYILVLAKPKREDTRGPKVINYNYLFGK